LASNSLPIRNAILKRLSSEEIEVLGPVERVTLGVRDTVELAHSVNEYVYFIEDGVASTVHADSPEQATEIGLIGYEGMTGIGILYGDAETPFETFMQVEGAAIRCKTTQLNRLWVESETLRVAVGRYARAYAIQTACTAVANGRFRLEERLARWLLMIADRVGPSFHITHEFIAVMLAVRRPGVTLAIQVLEGHGHIKATRGLVQIVDRDGLLRLARKAYGLPEREYARLWSDSMHAVPLEPIRIGSTHNLA
jgi:CRP-like cAMP-binding protein